MKRKQIILFSLLLLYLTGCVTAINSDKIIAVKQRFFGLNISYNSATQQPSIVLGYGSSVFQMVPTSTNELHAPNYVDTFDLGQAINPFDTSISEDTATGNFSLGTNKPSSLGNSRLRTLKPLLLRTN